MRELTAAMEIEYLDDVKMAQREWVAVPIRLRVDVIRRLRVRLASTTREMAETVPTNLAGALSRTVADTLASEVLPLIEACRFLERSAADILRTRKLGHAGRPVWLFGVESEVERAPWGTVLILGAANYPLLLAGVQTLQALVAGNAVLWKPAPGASAAATALRTMLVECGLNYELLTVLESGVASASAVITAGVDYVVLTGSVETGKAVLRELAESLTPATMELSGCDAVFVLPGADPAYTVKAITFGLRFNGSFTCMAPRRLFLVGMADEDKQRFETLLARALGDLPAVALTRKSYELLRGLVADARSRGAEVLLDGLSGETGDSPHVGVTLIVGATPDLLSMQTEIFAPVLSVMRSADLEEALAAGAACPYGLTASVFGSEKEARSFASRLNVGNVLINDIVTSTADPRVPFGGRGRSGFGVTRGAEGLLGMTTPRTIQARRGGSVRVYEATGDGHVALFAAVAELLHGRGIGMRFAALKRVFGAGKRLK